MVVSVSIQKPGGVVPLFSSFHLLPLSISSPQPAYTPPPPQNQGHGIFESALIAEYIEEKWGPTRGTRLLPADPYDRAAVRLVVAHFRERTLPPLYRLLKAQTPAEAKLAKEQILVEMLAFEKLYAKHTPSHGPYFLGETFSLAEICVFPFLERLCLALQHYRGLNPLQDAHLPRLQEAFEHVHDRQAFKSTSQLPAFYVAVYESYAHPASCTATTGAACAGKGKTHLGWRVASWLSVAGATLPVVSILSFGTFLLGVGMGWSKARAQGRAGGHLTMG